MKLKGITLGQPNIVTIVIPRGDEDQIVFKAQAILDVKPFEQLCPAPQPPKIMFRGGEVKEDIEDETYKKSMQTYGELRTAWMILESLKATDGLEWEKVNLSDPNTWTLYREELKDAGFSEYEIARVVNGVLQANCLDEGKVQAARERFSRSQAAQVVS